MKKKQAREVDGEEGPTLSKTKTERVGHPRGFSAASMRHPPSRFCVKSQEILYKPSRDILYIQTLGFCDGGQCSTIVEHWASGSISRISVAQ